MRFDLLRFVLLRRQNADGSAESVPDREWWLRIHLAHEISFEHQGFRCLYHPVSPPLMLPFLEGEAPPFVIGRVELLGRTRKMRSSGRSPSKDVRKHHIFLDLIVDPRAHDDGQKGALQHNPEIGSAQALLSSLAQEINKITPLPSYVIYINAIAELDSFKKFVQDNPGRVTSVTFNLFAPNMFGVRTDLDREMHDLRDHEGMRRTNLTLENEDGLHLDTERAIRTAEYATEGGGSITAHTRSGEVYDSNEAGKSVNVTEQSVPQAGGEETRFQRIIKAAFF